ncbi:MULTISPECIES: hypothetical protein [unclassified Treponema]|uniref:hypothetical protein n=1 Tax=unclassified Treponema TaxID=2638727 RepID=UPI0020A3F414|nr:MULTISPECIES: hypothetical protein [unclassified Treponema]UTC67340.1 hypothetical protein E4O06_01320 [Treponema sp. OMZ 789]UTC70068.1 hypothetical protein E4O01_01315 [Treponema sp. OMZ 790]UTC72784.1 hypothetical protein E4O02_01315 [Treponema sp. OMZ 791]
MKTIKKIIFLIMFVCVSFSAFAFEKGFTLCLRANFSGSFTDPHINEADKKYLGAAFMDGMVGFVMNGEAELTYIFDSVRYFHYTNTNTFGGLGLAFNLGIGQGFSGQISGQYNDKLKKNIEVYSRVYMTPVLNFGTTLKVMLLKNRLSVGFGLGGKMLMDPQPTYELYSNLNEEELEELKKTGVNFYPETGTLLIPRSMMKKMNPLSALLRLSIEYNQPIISTMGLTLGGYLSYSIFKPGYVALPKKVEQAAIINGLTQTPPVHVNFEKYPIKSFFMNNLDFGVSLGLLFKV